MEGAIIKVPRKVDEAIWHILTEGGEVEAQQLAQMAIKELEAGEDPLPYLQAELNRLESAVGQSI